MTQTLLPTPTTVHWGYFDATLKPVATIDPGETIVIDSVSGSAESRPTQHGMTVRPELDAVLQAVKPDLGPHILTGPVAVRGAMPGDALRVEILDVKLADDWGFTLFKPGMGTLPDDFPYARTVYLPIDTAERVIDTTWGIRLKAQPFFGVMGVAPSPATGRASSVTPSYFGGNLDNKELGAGAVLYLPVSVEGALFSCGDGHAVQGDGEVCLTAVETGLTGTFKIDLAKDAKLDAPYAETKTHLIAMAFDEDLDEAARVALRRLIALIVARTTLSDADAYQLCSLVADLHVTQLVNRSKGIHAMIRHDILAQSKR
ncbi:acetamidase/formamidase family protein [Tardiphaga sp. 42S5]|uniref:acetamidase/formamidase family protein n=1 Tax=Tardiphaga sp. 42S5 TaxID=1404799 RepID=UPI002A5A8E21|nr:acetamidase/formamidase family protein [Tardiphaga sp. 42S5]WPO43750.1 acetamidase/formamidase family protein [Tardiphaga sp. 42S5]